MKKLVLIFAIMISSSMALANHVIECTDQRGEIIKAHMESTGNASYANIEITGVHYNGYNNNSSGVVYNVPVQIFSWGFKFDFQDANTDLPDYNFMYSVNGPTAQLTQDQPNGVPGAINWTKVNEPNNWQKLAADCISYEE